MFGDSTRNHMAEVLGNGSLLGARPKSEDTDTGTTTVEICLLDSFEDRVTMSEVFCEPKPGLEICAVSAPEETTKEPPAVSPPVAPLVTPTAVPAPESKPQWSVGSQCQAVWSDDGKEYAATIQSIEGERCRVMFDGYGNEESMPLSALKPPQPKSTQEWSAGSHCRARSSDGLCYPAVVLWVQGQRCRVRFYHSNSEEELDVGRLLSTGELNGPSHTGRGTTWRPAFSAGGRRRREVPDATNKREVERERGDRGAWDKICREPQQSTWQPKDRVPGQSREEGESEERRPTDRPSSHTFQPFPSFPPPPLHPISRDTPAFVPPPPPFWAFGAKEPSTPMDPTSQMLMMWYMCGFHTGSYLAQQQSKSSSRD